ncbi:CLUMA_CG003431, isoform A [Clunio marinus]|uniref:Inhibitor of growth protein n=1 Tax=Clunio marinus TaxID=568069 RepID=A0A1J1HNQ8_9DIPT|nr:CLUMA_CG003431, isoform A [Clunio marinus]
MLYLEDYLEMIEHLPQELRDRFTEMRELDLSVQNDTDTIDKQIRNFFGQCRRGELNGIHADAQFESIKKDYEKVREDSDEKVQLANQIYELVDRYLRRLDTELLKFKCELEADNHGITELLEKRSLELDGSSSGVNQKENRYFGSLSSNRVDRTERYRHKVEKRRDSGTPSQLGAPPEKRQPISSGLTTPTLRPATPNLTQVLQSNPSVSYTGNATIIAQAAAQAIEKTQQMQQGRRTASLKASYEAIHGSGMNTHELLMGRDLSASHALQSMDRDVSFASTASGSNNNPKRYKKKINSIGMGSSQSPQTTGSLLHQLQTHSNDSDEMPSSYINKDGMVVEQTADGEWTYDPNEPRYCICNQVSYGEMVACDNAECPLEWFHYPCVGITTSPKGKWYCPMCTKNRKKKNV